MLLELSCSAREDPLPNFLETVAEIVCQTAGFRAVVLNLFRAGWDDYEVVLVIGQEESVKALMGTSTPRAAFRRIFAEAEQRLPGVFFLAEESDFWNDLNDVFTPDLAKSKDPNAWRSGDGLLVFLSDSEGAPLGLVSMDEPIDGRRPTNEDLRLVRAICSHAEQALESARRREEAAENHKMLSLLLEVSPALSACATAGELMSMAGQSVVPHLGFERFAGYVVSDETLTLSATRGWGETASLSPTLSISAVESLLRPEREHAGCFIGSASELFPEVAAVGARSRRNGRGPFTWRDQCLVIPCREAEQRLLGLIVIEDPVDGMLPSDDRRRVVRLLVNQVSAALKSIEHRSRLNHLATHDSLTGVRNRRGLDDVIGAHLNVALLICDLDKFKQINDRYGHERGDQVLACFGELLRELARENDTPIRLGGEEFCIVMPNTDPAGALQAAERLRRETSRRLRKLVSSKITVSVGVAATSHGVLDARALLAAADRGLYAAKTAGRDRSVLLPSPNDDSATSAAHPQPHPLHPELTDSPKNVSRAEQPRRLRGQTGPPRSEQ
ncbi:MAG: sensor domain-containing diguanylate cyclase [Solirubrobacteraceae bacterium]